MEGFSLASALQQRLLPAITFEKEEHALPVAEALLNAGLFVMEIPFRTVVAEKAVSVIRKHFPEMKVGAGTILSLEQLQAAINAGAQFGLSPGLNRTVCNKANLKNFPFIPGVMTPSEIESAVEMRFIILKLFPAEQVGGVRFLKAMQGPYEQLNVRFIPMGGINEQNMKAYLQLKNVMAVGGSWLATPEMMVNKDYGTIRQQVLEALQQIK